MAPKKQAATPQQQQQATDSSTSKQQRRAQQQQPQQQQQQQAASPLRRPRQQEPALPQPQPGNDDLLPAAPPAFPQPVSSLPRDANQYYHPAALFPAAPHPAGAAAFPSDLGLGLPVSSSAQSFGGLLPQPQQQQQQQQQRQPWPPGAAMAAAAAGGGLPALNGAATVGPGGLLQLPQPPGGAAGSAPFGYTVDGLPLPYDVAMAPYAAVYASGGYGGGGYNDASLPLLTDSAGFAGDMVFANRQVRHAFVRKVLGLVTLQLLLTAGVAVPILSHKPVRRFLHANPWAFFIALVLTVTLLLVMACSEGVRRARPGNLGLLAAFTLAEGCAVGAASATYQTHVLVVGLLISAAACLALIAYASQTGADFTTPGGVLLSAGAVLLVVGLAEHFLGFKTLHLLIGGCGALLFCAYLVYAVQALASGDSCYAVAADEYVFGAVTVYTDVINIGVGLVGLLTRHGGDDEGIEH